jgi:hypothetical protein
VLAPISAAGCSQPASLAREVRRQPIRLRAPHGLMSRGC